MTKHTDKKDGQPDYEDVDTDDEDYVQWGSDEESFDEDEEEDFDESTNKILDSQMDGVFKPKPKVPAYKPYNYGGYNYGKGYNDIYDSYDSYDKEANAKKVEKAAENIIKNMESYPATITTVATYQSVEMMEEILRQLLNR